MESQLLTLAVGGYNFGERLVPNNVPVGVAVELSFLGLLSLIYLVFYLFVVPFWVYRSYRSLRRIEKLLKPKE